MNARFQQLVSQSKVAVAILSTPARDNFELCDLKSLSTEHAADRELVGMIGVVEFSPLKTLVVLTVPLDAAMAVAIGERFGRLLVRAVAHAEKAYLPTIRMEAN